jgi:hypothetical protein
MNCFTHNTRSAVGICSVCQKAVCHECVGQDTPRIVCRTCAARGAAAIGWGYAGYAYRGFEYKSPISIGGWPLLHVCSGIDPETMRPRVAKGIVAIGNIAVGGLAIGGLSCGLFTLGGASIGILGALGGAALGLGLSIGGLAVGSIAVGGAAIGFVHAIGGAAFGPSVISGMRCDDTALDFFRQWIAAIPRNCR